MGEDAPRLHSTLTGSIIGAAQKVYRVLGHGFLEKVYQNALRLELEALGLKSKPRLRSKCAIGAGWWASTKRICW